MTEDEIIAHAQQFSTRSSWKRACKGLSPNPWRLARDQKSTIWAKCVAHMEDQRKYSIPPDPTKWTEEALLASAQVYKHPVDWKKGHRGAYYAALRHGRAFYDKCVAHMKPKVNPFVTGWTIYKYEFSPSATIYVGLTHKQDGSRWKGHEKSGPVCEYWAEHPDEKPRRYMLQTGIIDAEEAKAVEDHWINYYVSLGHNVLNKARAGSLGSVIKISNVKIKEDALQYSTRTQWHDNHQSYYHIARRRGILDECCAHMEDQRKGQGSVIKHTDEDIIADAQKHKTLPEWRKASPTLYAIAYKRGIQDQCKAHMSETKWKKQKWTDEALLESALKYQDKKAWRQNEPSAMSTATARGKEFLAKCTAHMPKRFKKGGN